MIHAVRRRLLRLGASKPWDACAALSGIARTGAVLVLAALSTGCERETRIALEVTWDHDGPVADLAVTALPFDPDHLLDSLAGEVDIPAPTFPALEAEIHEFSRPDPDPYEEINRPWLALRDTVRELADSLIDRDRTESGYAADYDRFRALYARLAERAAERDRALRAVNGDHLDLARRAAAAADSLRSWEYQAYAGYPEAAAAAVVHAGRSVIEGTTDHHGRLTLRVQPGRWWLVARTADPENPFLEYYWNVPVTATRVVPVRLPLSSANATKRWRH